jgi:hypothetical protein
MLRTKSDSSSTAAAKMSLLRNPKGKESRVRYWEIIADNLSKAGWSWGCVAIVDSNGANNLGS